MFKSFKSENLQVFAKGPKGEQRPNLGEVIAKDSLWT